MTRLWGEMKVIGTIPTLRLFGAEARAQYRPVPSVESVERSRSAKVDTRKMVNYAWAR